MAKLCEFHERCAAMLNSLRPSEMAMANHCEFFEQNAAMLVRSETSPLTNNVRDACNQNRRMMKQL